MSATWTKTAGVLLKQLVPQWIVRLLERRNEKIRKTREDGDAEIRRWMGRKR